MMELVNVLSSSVAEDNKQEVEPAVIREAISVLLILLSPMVPHFTAEMWQIIGNIDSVEEQPWPQIDGEAVKEDLITMVIQVNGKVRSRLQVAPDITEESLIELAHGDKNTNKFIADKPIKKTIVIQKKLVNIVI
jgi:leucyl-tRNA synthetase